MISTHLQSSRYLSKARAAYAARLIAVGAIIAVPAACGNSDESAFSTTSTASTASTASTTVAVVETAATNPATSAANTSAATAAETAAATVAETEAPVTTGQGTTAPTGGTAIPAGGSLTLDFTFAASGGKNPYIASWVEDADGNIVQTISLWFESGKGEKWLNDLTSWYNSASGTDVTSSGATRAPGTFSVAWDGTDLTGAAAAAGTYTIFIESAVERGNHSITSAEVTLDGSATTATMTDNGDLTGVTLTIA